MLDQVEAGDVPLLERLAGERLNRNRDVLHVLGAPLRRGDDFLDSEPRWRDAA